MWGQDWSPLIKLFVPSNEQLDLDGKMKRKMWSITDMVREAEDFYVSLGFPQLTKKFWELSVFVENENTSMCHGTAANLFDDGDYRWEEFLLWFCGFKVCFKDVDVRSGEYGGFLCDSSRNGPHYVLHGV